jgi:hypothetical protein
MIAAYFLKPACIGRVDRRRAYIEFTRKTKKTSRQSHKFLKAISSSAPILPWRYSQAVESTLDLRSV